MTPAIFVLLAVLTCDPSVFTLYKRPAGVATTAIPEKSIPGAVERNKALVRLDADAMSAMIGLREGYLQRVIWPYLVEAGGVAKATHMTGDMTEINFCPSNNTCVGDSWISDPPNIVGFAEDVKNYSNRVYRTPRITTSLKSRCDEIISKFLARESGFHPPRGYANWLTPSIDHLGLCKFGVDVDGEAGSLIDFESGAFLPLSRCLDDVTNPEVSAGESESFGNGFWDSSVQNFRPNALLRDYPWAHDVDDGACLGFTCTSTNMGAGTVSYDDHDIRIGPRLSELLCAAAPGLPSDATNLYRIATGRRWGSTNACEISTSNPRILWDRFALANGLLGLTTDLLFTECYAPTPGPQNWDTRDVGYDVRHCRDVCNGTYLFVDSSSRAENIWSIKFPDGELTTDNSPVVYGEMVNSNNVSEGFGMFVDLSKIEKVYELSTNLSFSVNVYTSSLDGTEFYWSDGDAEYGWRSFGAFVTVTQNLQLVTFNDSDDNARAENIDLYQVDDGVFPPSCFQLGWEHSYVGDREIPTALVVKWSDEEVVPERLRGRTLQRLSKFPLSGISAEVHAVRTAESYGSIPLDVEWMPFVDPYSDLTQYAGNVYLANFFSSGMFPASSGLAKYVDFNILSLISASAYTNEWRAAVYIHPHGPTNATKMVRTSLERHNVTPDRLNITRAMISDRTTAWKKMVNLHNDVLEWGDGQTPRELYSLWNTNAMAHLDKDLTQMMLAALTNTIRSGAWTMFPCQIANDQPNLKLTVTTDEDGLRYASWARECDDLPIATLGGSLVRNPTPPKRHSPVVEFDIQHAIYMKFKFPMFDSSGTTWPGWQPQKEYEPFPR